MLCRNACMQRNDGDDDDDVMMRAQAWSTSRVSVVSRCFV